MKKPMIGICAGFNNILRAIGTEVIEDKTKSHDCYDKDYRHKIKIEKGTLIYNLIKKEQYSVNSIHTLVATKELVEPYAKISSFSEDGLVESFELQNKKFVVGIKWHPELMNDQFVNDLFKIFMDKCRN